jgi:aminoglycoside phosphotransferase (APT) family kinase protein
MQNPEFQAGLETTKLDAFLRREIAGLEGRMTVEKIPGGQSNPTYFVSYDNRRLVLRKRPANALPSAHAVDREFRVMRALRDSPVPVPDALLYHDGEDIIGTAFFVMERLDGRVFSDCSLPGVRPAERGVMFLAMADTLADLHKVDWNTVGLADYGKPGNYYKRQIARWSRQWELSKRRDLPELTRLLAWLPANIPAGDTTAISHGDFRIGNLMFHPTEPRVVGVLDWELSTLGHPLADLAYSALAWRLLPTEYMGMRGADLEALGIPTEATYLQRYYDRMGGDDRVEPFHYAFALFRLAVIFEGIAARAQAGQASSANAAEVGELSVDFARRAIEAIDAI